MKEDFAKGYGSLQEWHWWFRGRRQILESVLSAELSSTAAHRILSIGSGPAGGLKWLLPFARAGGAVVGLDPDPLHGSNVPTDIEFVTGSLERAPWSDATFDVVLALDLLEHLDDDLGALREALRVTRPGGLLLITVPALPSLWGNQDVVSEHRRRYTKRSLALLLRRAGVRQYAMTYFNTLLFPLVAARRWPRRLLGSPPSGRSDFDDSRPGVLNDVLAGIFAAERLLIHTILAPIGVSLMVKHRPSRREAP